jgi:four helix bundle protein
MNRDDMKEKTMIFALKIIRLSEAIPDNGAGRIIKSQILRCGTSVGANYRAACRARSTAEFVAKMGIVEEESDETMYWMEVLVKSGLLRLQDTKDLMRDADEILAITVASIKTARKGAR